MSRLAGAVAVVTGAGHGIGRAIAERFARDGVRLLLSDVNPRTLEATTAAVESRCEAVEIVADVSDEAAVARLAEAAIAEFGVVNILCNNAGIEMGGAFSRTDTEVWHRVMGVNFYGQLYGCRAFLPHLSAAPWGHIVNMASMSAIDARIPTYGPYVASKFALLGMTENLAIELAATGSDVGVSVVLPGPVDTGFVDAGDVRLGGPADGAVDNEPLRSTVTSNLRRSLRQKGLAPGAIAAQVVDAIVSRRFYVLPHPDSAHEALAVRRAWMDGRQPAARALEPVTPR